MFVCELKRSLDKYKTLHFADVVAGNEDGTLDFRYSFHGDKPLSQTWIPPHVVYLEEMVLRETFPIFGVQIAQSSHIVRLPWFETSFLPLVSSCH